MNENLENKINDVLTSSEQLRNNLRENIEKMNEWTFTQPKSSLVTRESITKDAIFWFVILLIIWILFLLTKGLLQTNASYEQDLQTKIQKELEFYETERIKLVDQWLAKDTLKEPLYTWKSESKDLTTDKTISNSNKDKNIWENVKIKLKRFVQDSTPRTDKVVITSDKPFTVYKNGEKKEKTYTRYEIEKREQDMMNTTNWKNEYYEFVSSDKNTPLVIKSRDRIPSWIKDEDSRKRNNDNQFLWKIRYQNVNSEETYINELPLEDYMKGIAETASRTHKEKKKAMSIMARSYIYFYTHSLFKKFEWKSYDLEDDPATSQKYLGYGYQQRNTEWVDIVNETSWKVLVDEKNNPFIAPYSTCTLRNEKGELKRKTLEQAKRWNEKKWDIYKFGTNVITDVEDTYWECDAKQTAGHWVWLSGNGSEKLASEHNYKYDQIINYYFKNITIKNIKDL